jgi:hypothetical protein
LDEIGSELLRCRGGFGVDLHCACCRESCLQLLSTICVFIRESKLRAFGKGKNKKDKVSESASGLDEKENGDNNSTIAKNKSKDHTPVSFLGKGTVPRYCSTPHQ